MSASRQGAAVVRRLSGVAKPDSALGFELLEVGTAVCRKHERNKELRPRRYLARDRRWPQRHHRSESLASTVGPGRCGRRRSCSGASLRRLRCTGSDEKRVVGGSALRRPLGDGHNCGLSPVVFPRRIEAFVYPLPSRARELLVDQRARGRLVNVDLGSRRFGLCDDCFVACVGLAWLLLAGPVAAQQVRSSPAPLRWRAVPRARGLPVPWRPLLGAQSRARFGLLRPPDLVGLGAGLVEGRRRRSSSSSWSASAARAGSGGGTKAPAGKPGSEKVRWNQTPSSRESLRVVSASRDRRCCGAGTVAGGSELVKQVADLGGTMRRT